MKESYKRILDEYHGLSEQLAKASPAEIAKLGKRQAELLPVLELVQELQRNEKELDENKLLADGGDELAAIALSLIHI